MMILERTRRGPLVLLRISDGISQMHRTFDDFAHAYRSAEAFAGAGYAVAMISATGQFLMGFPPRDDGLPAARPPRGGVGRSGHFRGESGPRAARTREKPGDNRPGG
jgi:hypothetical protein